MGLVVKGLNGHNPAIKLSHGKVIVRMKGYFLEILHEDGGVTSQILTDPQAVEIAVDPRGAP